jgi:hypothetical protein
VDILELVFAGVVIGEVLFAIIAVALIVSGRLWDSTPPD